MSVQTLVGKGLDFEIVLSIAGVGMKIKNRNNSDALIELSSHEIITINNALNEVCNGVGLEGEFDTRMGCTVEQARRLLAEIGQLGASMNKAD